MTTDLHAASASHRTELPVVGAERAVPAIVERLRSLRCLVAVARQGSAIRAAEAIHLSQPAVTRAVLDLEAYCGLALFERASRGMIATAAGERAAQRAEMLLQHLARGASEALALAPPQARRAGLPDRFAGAVPAASLKALAAVAISASEARAAEALGISQPAVHRSLHLLEDLAGVALFQKSARGTRLTHSGEALLRRIKLAFAEARAMESDIAAWRGEVRGRVIVGALPLSVSMVLPRAVDAVLRRHPDMEVTVVDGTYESLTQQLLSADVDVIVGALRPDSAMDEVRQEVLFNDDLAVVARAGHPCLDGTKLQLADLLAWEWVVPLQNTPASFAMARVFGTLGLPVPKGQLQANSPAITRSLVMQAGRLALSSRGQALQDDDTGQLRVVPVTLPDTMRPIGVAMRNMGEPSPDLRVLLNELRDVAETLRR
ncbi:MAG TPA: LysR family transcriptional regulator [Ideonella sp.]|nr:LysR family transcriptional regulator [Ideonella sp.]